MDIEKAKILDGILQKFSGNVTISWESLREEFKNDMNKYYILENNINFLVSDGMLKRDTILHTLCMTDKGFATMTDPKNLGYLVKAKKERTESRVKYIAFSLTISTFLILLYNNLIAPKLNSAKVSSQDLILETEKTNSTIDQNTIIDTIITNNDNSFSIQVQKINADIALLTSNSKELDTIYYNGLSSIDFIDFNNDKNIDILVSYIGNNPTKELYLFDPKNNDFKFIDAFINFCDSKPLKSNTQYYYSYQRAGCADQNWVSDIFTINNFKIIHLGHIYGMSCDDSYKIIEIYKITDNNEKIKLIEKLPYDKNIATNKDKWDFIENYWNTCYEKFK
jgi:hypothetical protein